MKPAVSGTPASDSTDRVMHGREEGTLPEQAAQVRQPLGVVAAVRR
jgi:hypothetical protein